MEFLHRDDFSAGWLASSDLAKCPINGYLRGDNLLLDEQGVIALRPGSRTLNPVDALGNLTYIKSALSTVHSIFTATINRVRNRYFGATDENDLGVVWKDFASLASFDGSGDIFMGSFQGMFLATRGTTHWKHDGVNTRTWGITAPTVKPALTVLDPRVISVATFDVSDQPNWIPQGGEGITQSTVGRDGAVGGALNVNPSALTGRATIQKYFTDVQNYNLFDGSVAGAPEDSIEFYMWISNPSALKRIIISFDVNPQSSAPFQDDYYYFELAGQDAVEVKLDPKQVLDGQQSLDQLDRDRLDDKYIFRRPTRTRTRDDAPNSANSGWSKFVILRGQMERVGSTPGCDWNTVKAVQLTFEYTPSQTATTPGAVNFDGLRILGGADRTLTGKYRVKTQYTRIFDNYVAISPPSPISDEIECRNNAIVAHQDVTGVDFQVQQPGGGIIAYVAGGSMQNFYSGGSSGVGAGPSDIICSTSERDMIVINLVLEDDLVLPPNNVVAIVGPHFNKILLLTAKKIYISRDGDPDGYRAGQVLDLADPAEVIQWGIKTDTTVYIGTTRDVYRLGGSLSLLPDGTTDARLAPLGIEGPPISSFVAQDGGQVAYHSADGIRVLQGAGSTPINWNLDLLIQGYTRHGASVNFSPLSGRLSGGFDFGRLYINLGGSNFVYVADFKRQSWRRELYNQAFNRLYREPDGSMVAGDSTGRAWSLITQDQGDKVGSANPTPIAITYYSGSDDNGKPLQYKEGFDWRAELDTGGLNATVDLFLDDAVGLSLTVARNGYGPVQQTFGSNASVRPFRKVQHRITGSFAVFKMGLFAISYRPRPIPMLYWDSSLLNFGTQDIVWLRELKFEGRSPVNLRARVKFEGVTRLDTTIVVTPGVDSIWKVDVGPEVKGRLPLIILEPISGLTTPDSAFEPYFVQVKWKGTGGITEKKFKIQPAT